MRKLLSIFLLAAFLFQSTNKLWIMVSFYIQQDYIAKNICINRFDLIPICEGQCYLTSQLKKSDKQEQNIPDIKLKDVQLFFAQLVNFKFSFLKSPVLKPTIYPQSQQHQSDFWCSIFHPPQSIILSEV
ncbi:hypothetical protein [Pedobacter cryoconitis]|uniref:hypothetical protein n=1 Tax=Pedobacter cryoconitis TaxID=188932 RepID=UPI00160D823C|nr:hypothetical protein [Pedobacter cryoconitis]MBB5645723.1 hypothetical protein [Pedobacter cryoconitis]